MLKITKTFEDFNGNERTEDLYFNLTKAELMEMEVSAEGGLEATINKIISAQNGKEILDLFKGIIIKAYGEKSLDGKTFDKSEEAKNRFINSQAFSDVLMDLATDTNKATEFFNGIIPKDLAAEIKKEQNKGNLKPVNNN